LRQALQEAARSAVAAGALPELPVQMPHFWVKASPQVRGVLQYEFASNAALVLGAMLRMEAGAVAAVLKSHLEAGGKWPGRMEEANGYLNFRMDDGFIEAQLSRAVREGERYGAGDTLKDRRINVEFVSADPTGPLPFALGRIAAAGDALCRVLEFQGADVTREFYLNDVESSSNMRLLGESVAAYYLESFHRAGERPEGALTSDFVRGVAEAIVQREGNRYLLVPDAERAAAFAHEARDAAVAAQKQALQKLGVRFDVWTSEAVLRREGRVSSALEKLRAAGHTYEKDGGLWLRTTAFGDEADRPLVRSGAPGDGTGEGQPTYLAADIAYHSFKFERGFDLLLNIWTKQHAPYVARTRAALQAAGYDPGKIEVILSEGAVWMRDGSLQEEAFSLEDALHRLDCSSLRFWFLLHDWDVRIEIDTEIAQRDDEKNPAYAARLVPSRLGTMIRELEASASAQNITANQMDGSWSDAEREVARLVALWPDAAETAALQREPQRIARSMNDLAIAVRRLLEASRPAATQPETDNSAGRLPLLRAAQVTAFNALRLLGVEASETF
jgi:arginyl-tRNA synthetase